MERLEHPAIPQPDIPVTVLVVSPAEQDRTALQSITSGSNWRLHAARDCREALSFVAQNEVPVVICECVLPDGHWSVLFDYTSGLSRPPSFIVSSRLADDGLWGEVLSAGAYDLLATPFEAAEVLRVLHLAWAARARELAREPLRKTAQSEHSGSPARESAGWPE